EEAAGSDDADGVEGPEGGTDSAAVPTSMVTRFVDMGEAVELSEGSQWGYSSVDLHSDEPMNLAGAVDLESGLPGWVSGTETVRSTVEKSAREGLTGLVHPKADLGIELREALRFRRSEVGALAGQLLLLMDEPEVYFGSDGIFNDPKQKLHWSKHHTVMQAYLNSGVSKVQRVHSAIEKMEQADLPALKKLLTGFKSAELTDGGDEQLIEWLDSSAMAVRVLALENLREITGTTGYFNAAEDNVNRRQDDVKKWRIRARKGDIRRQ
ncbi:MAG: hypothetical protein AAF989_17440, partial [Planctomycetota bacterium]